ncbi:alkene reductase [Chryseobacterium sp. RG1]|uniref:Alkene reductase n=1 Tax=Chryseobacterium tagetis TaxID=2801334 RepID=A0ABS8A242_9FLAO|nr:alkene reductase [Chryseobacterium tagetis]MCA6068008.1 alkene reductase [Chryseobacterium tagetis]
MNLLSQYNTNLLELKNRVVMAPLTRSRAHNDDLVPTSLHTEYYSQRASAGLIISEGLALSTRATGYINVPGIYSKKQINAWREVTDAIHASEGQIFAQLWHVGRISHPDLLGGRLPLAPSAINPEYQAYTDKGFVDTVAPKEMNFDDINQTIEDFVQAAKNAVQAGFDGIEIHAANGYLFHQFFAKCSNHREDMYGGSIENRARFLFEVIEEILENIPNIKIGVRLSPTFTNIFGIILDDETDKLFDYIIGKLNNYSLAYLHISGFSHDPVNALETIITTSKHYRKIYNGTFIINGGFSQHKAEEVIEDGTADLVSFGRLFISNPDLVKRFEEQLPLNEWDISTFYTLGAAGYTDYPFYERV